MNCIINFTKIELKGNRMESTIIQVAEGQIKGCAWKILNGERILAFLGVPYAKPPIGDLRFKAPQPAEPWQGIRECTKDGSPCLNYDMLEGILRGSEDCLYLNIYTKSVKSELLKPVLVFIHGGAFVSGSNESKMYGPDFLVAEDIVLVTINYRVGLLGFLSLEDASFGVPGNAGLKDQALALQWVQKNIQNFGGDPKNVTIAGESAGSRSVHYHILSRTSKGLFHKAIMQSGVSASPWDDNIKSKDVVSILDIAGVTVKDEREAFQYLMKISGEEVWNIQQKFVQSAEFTLRTIGPVIEKPNPTAFITQEPYELLRTGQYNMVPILMGFCDREGLMDMVAKSQSKKTMLDKSVEEILALTLSLDKDSDIVKDLARNIEKVYFAYDDSDGKLLLYSDILYIVPIIRAAQLHAMTSSDPVYLYRFSADAGLNMMKKFAKLRHPGACHADDIGYMFKTYLLPPPPKNSKEEKIVCNFVKLLTNFAKTGNPTPSVNDLNVLWKRIEKDNVNILDISEVLKPDSNPHPERMILWLEFAEKMKRHRLSGLDHN